MAKKIFYMVHDQARQNAISAIQSAPSGYLVEVKEPGRSLDQNAISHAWYQQLAKELPEDDALGWKCFCKLNFGVPILRAEDLNFKESYDKTVKNSLSYEMKLELMKWFSVTSEMTKSQLSKYLESMQVYFISRNVVLSFPEVAA